jgi:Fe-S cluster assembly protein SufD
MVQMMEKPPTNPTDPRVEKFERLEKDAGQPAWVFPLRKAGIARFAEVGFPTLKDEDWRFTNVAPIVKLPFKPVVQPSANVLTREDLARLTFGSLTGPRLVFVNGHYASEISSPPASEGGVIAGSLAAALANDSGLLQNHFARYIQGADNAFAALNAAFFSDGGFVYVPAGKILEPPIHLLFVSTAKETGAAIHPRNLIILEKAARATVLESYLSLSDAAYFTNALTEIAVGEDAALEHCKFQDESPNAFHVAGTHARLGRGCNFLSHSIATGARLSRNDIRTVLAGEGIQCVLNGLYLTKGDQLSDHHMVVEHAQPHCSSHEYYNGILDDRSKGVFHGRILVRPAAQKTDAKQTNKNLLLSETATINTKPQLEIYADDVKCTHGATVGQLNEDSIFYLRARGLSADTARRMLIHAFAGEITERIRHAPAREELDRLLWGRLEANPLVGEQNQDVRRPQ